MSTTASQILLARDRATDQSGVGGSEAEHATKSAVGGSDADRTLTARVGSSDAECSLTSGVGSSDAERSLTSCVESGEADRVVTEACELVDRRHRSARHEAMVSRLSESEQEMLRPVLDSLLTELNIAAQRCSVTETTFLQLYERINNLPSTYSQ